MKLFLCYEPWMSHSFIISKGFAIINTYNKNKLLEKHELRIDVKVYTTYNDPTVWSSSPCLNEWGSPH